jgi:hypothetical protein
MTQLGVSVVNFVEYVPTVAGLPHVFISLYQNIVQLLLYVWCFTLQHGIWITLN